MKIFSSLPTSCLLVGLYFIILFSHQSVQGQTKTAAKTTASAKTNLFTNKSVIDLHKAELGDEIILAKIAQSKCAFDLSTEGLIDLKSKGVSGEVIKAMMDAGKSTGATVGSTSEVKTNKEAFKSNKTEASAATAPELMNHVYMLPKGSSQVKPLEKAMAGKRTRNFGFKALVLLQVDGANSGVSIGFGGIEYFLINTGGSSLPEVALYVLKSAKGKREVESGSVGTFEGVKTGEKNQVPLNISKLDNGVFKIMPTKELAKGEYFFTTKPEATATSFDVYTFGMK